MTRNDEAMITLMHRMAEAILERNYWEGESAVLMDCGSRARYQAADREEHLAQQEVARLEAVLLRWHEGKDVLLHLLGEERVNTNGL